MIEVEVLKDKTDEELLRLFNILKKRIEAQDFVESAKTIFENKYNSLKQEIERRGIVIN